MSAVETVPVNIAEMSRCGKRSQLTAEDQRIQQKVDKADASIADKVERALWNVGVMRSSEDRDIDFAVQDGIVFLSGHVIFLSNLQRVENAVQTIPGVLGVRSDLVADDIITQDVAGALGKLEHLHRVKFFTGTRYGVVVLNGDVSSPDIRLSAEKYAAKIPGVRGVINYVRVTGVDEEPKDSRFLQPPIRQQVYFTDGLSGTIQKVIINPNNRRVIGMVVRGRYSNPKQDPRFQAYGEDQLPERLIVIDMSAVRFITRISGFLKIDSAEAASYQDFDSSNYAAPEKGWAPPYPYCPDDVLLPIETSKGIQPTLSQPPDQRQT